MTTTLEPTVTEADPFAHIEYVDPFPGRNGEDKIKSTCGRCSGEGSVSWGSNVNGVLTLTNKDGQVVGSRVVPQVCFECNGVGYHMRAIKNIRAAERRRVREHNKAMDQARAFVAQADVREAEEAFRLESYRAAHTDVAAALDLVGGDFAESLTEQIKGHGGLSEKQTTAILEAAQRVTAKAAQEWIGTEGQQVTFEARVEDVKVFDGYAYGTSSYLFILRTTAGDKVSVFTSAQFMFDLRDSGETALLTATVKEHKEYQGAKETQVARIKKAKKA